MLGLIALALTMLSVMKGKDICVLGNVASWSTVNGPMKDADV